jgi:pentatricopeptide repeat protein
MDNALQPAGASEQGINLQHHDESEVKSEVAPLDASAPEPSGEAALEPSREAAPEHSHCCLEIGIVFCIVLPALYLNTRPDKNGQRHHEPLDHGAPQPRSQVNSNAPRYESNEARRLAHWNQAINNAAKASNVKKAESLLEDMYQHGDQPDIISYNSVIHACAKKGDIERAQRWLTEMHEKDIQPNTVTYNNLLDCCVKVDDIDVAEDWLDRMENSGVTADVSACSSVLDACSKAGILKRARDTLDQLRSRGLSPSVAFYASLARPFAQHGDWMEVERLAEELKAEGLEMNDYFLYALLLSYATAHPRQAGRAEAAFREACSQNVQMNSFVQTAAVRAMGRLRCEQLAAELNVTFSISAKHRSQRPSTDLLGETQELLTSKPALGRSSA